MAQIRPRIAISYGRINQPIRVPVDDILLNPITQSFLLTNTASGLTSLRVQNNFVFNNAQWLAVGEQGNQVTEIISTVASGAVSGNTLSLGKPLKFNHSAGSWVKAIPYNQVEISYAATATGSKTVLALTTIAVGLTENRYVDTATSGYYFARYKNSITGSFSDYSDAAPYNGYTVLSARKQIDNALGMINKKTSEVLPDEFFFNEINNCQMESLREFKRWSFMQSFDTIVTRTATGMWRFTLPTNCDDQNTTKSIYNLRIGKDLNMVWVDKEDWNNLISDIAYSQISSTSVVGSTSLYLDNSGDFDDSGSISLRGHSISYSANNRATNTLTVSALVTRAAAGYDIFQFMFPGCPVYFTTFGGEVYHWPVTSDTYANRNYYLDYYKKLTLIETDTDEIVLPDPTVVQYYLAWKALLKLSNGEPTPGSQNMFEQYILRREKMKQKESLNRQFVLQPGRGTNQSTIL